MWYLYLCLKYLLTSLYALDTDPSRGLYPIYTRNIWARGPAQLNVGRPRFYFVFTQHSVWAGRVIFFCTSIVDISINQSGPAQSVCVNRVNNNCVMVLYGAMEKRSASNSFGNIRSRDISRDLFLKKTTYGFVGNFLPKNSSQLS